MVRTPLARVRVEWAVVRVSGGGRGWEEGGDLVADARKPPEQLVEEPPIIASSRGWWVRIGLLFVVSVIVAIAVAAVTDEPANSGFVDGAAVLAFVAGIAAGLERTIEVVWARVDRDETKGAWWPLSVVTGELSAVEKRTNEVLSPLVADVRQHLGTAEGFAGDARAKEKAVDLVAAQIQERAAATKEAIANAQKLAPGSSRFAAIARATDDFAHDAELMARNAGLWSRDLERGLRAAGDVLSSAQDVVGAFKDNPARKTMSIALGVPLGILAIGVLGLNMFSAVLGPDVPSYMAGLGGILATGVVVGLGSNPTHEVIKALQRRKGDATIDVPVASSVQVVRTEVPVGAAARTAPTIETLDSEADTRSRPADVQDLVTPPAPPTAVQTTYVSRRQVRPIRHAG
jgi:hypothetical protein